MLRCVACALCAVLCSVWVVTAARADVTYTWETLSATWAMPDTVPYSFSPPGPLALSFTVSGPISFEADSSFANVPPGLPPASQVQYPFPPQVVNFYLNIGLLTITSNSFISPLEPGSSGVLGYPQWSISLMANNSLASLGLNFTDAIDSQMRGWNI